jgi:glutaminyl-peptide cyclotransferase
MEASVRVASTRTTWLLVAFATLGALTAAPARTGRRAAPPLSPAPPDSLRVKVVRSFFHDSRAFTQGLVFHAGKLYESTGLLGRSSLRRVDPATGAVEAQVPLERSLFGEGLALAEGRLVQLTWTGGRALLWSLDRLSPEGQWRYTGEGWGLCSDGTHFLMSDGSDRLVRRDLRTFEVVGAVSVRTTEGPVDRLNELECVGDTVYANVWQTSRIARVDARTGRVTAWIEAAGLLTEAEAREADVLNGIAYLPSSGRFVLTGKLWPRAFEVELVPAR